MATLFSRRVQGHPPTDALLVGLSCLRFIIRGCTHSSHARLPIDASARIKKMVVIGMMSHLLQAMSLRIPEVQHQVG